MNPAFHARRVAGLEDFVRGLVGVLLDELGPGETVDAVERLAVPLPLAVIAELLGIPDEDRDRFRRWTDAIIEAADRQTDDTLVHLGELYTYFGAIAADRRRSPRDDLVSVLVQSEVDGQRLSDAEIMGFCMTLLVAGNETTRNLISGGILALAEHPDQRKQLAADRAAVAIGVEELLRWVTPVTSFCRTATRDVELGERAIREGDYVLLVYASANRDEAAFGPTAGLVDVTRQPNNHVAFGFAEHFCLGAGLARLETRVLFEELLTRLGASGPARPAPIDADARAHEPARRARRRLTPPTASCSSAPRSWPRLAPR